MIYVRVLAVRRWVDSTEAQIIFETHAELDHWRPTQGVLTNTSNISVHRTFTCKSLHNRIQVALRIGPMKLKKKSSEEATSSRYPGLVLENHLIPSYSIKIAAELQFFKNFAIPSFPKEEDSPSTKAFFQ